MTQLTDIPFLPKLPATLGNLSIAGAVLLSVFVWLIGRKLIWGRPTLDIGEFSTKETNASDGARFTSLLEHSLMDLGRSRKGPEKILMVSGPIHATMVSINQILPFSQGWTKLTEVLSKLVAWLLAKPSFVVSGEIHHETDSAGKTSVTGITLDFQKGMRILNKHLIETSDFALNSDQTQRLWTESP
ncbi:MAG: hypothetical protein KZQ81_18630 [Candidatus Thiodiazotropha sp. (ex Rostrolucina anterorostrata)]|nr:hypothetical protein [Candidatus Thiodiazotropha sp. (ex Rostrolucina anterorostrata)]